MKVLFWLFMSLDRHSTSGHLLMAVMEQTKKLGHDVHVICKETGGEEREHLEKLNKLDIEVKSQKFEAPKKSNFAKRYLAELNYIKSSAKLINDDYDAVFIQSNISAGYAVKEAKRKCPGATITYNVQDVYPQDVMYAGKIGKNNPAYIAMCLVQRGAYKNADHIITISEDMKDLIQEEGASEQKTSVIYNWSYQDTVFEKQNIAPEIADLFDAQYFNAVYAGNIGLFQNVDVVIEAAIRLRGHHDIWFHIFGNGLYKDKLEEKAKANNIRNITFHPIQPHALAPSIYASASVNLIPLGKNQYRAALPSKTATCLACQRPIIFSIGKESKYGKIIQKQTGCPVLDSGDADALAKSIVKIKENGISIQTGKFFEENCSISKNSLAYAKIITSAT